MLALHIVCCSHVIMYFQAQYLNEWNTLPGFVVCPTAAPHASLPVITINKNDGGGIFLLLKTQDVTCSSVSFGGAGGFDVFIFGQSQSKSFPLFPET